MFFSYSCSMEYLAGFGEEAKKINYSIVNEKDNFCFDNERVNFVQTFTRAWEDKLARLERVICQMDIDFDKKGSFMSRLSWLREQDYINTIVDRVYLQITLMTEELFVRLKNGFDIYEDKFDLLLTDVESCDAIDGLFICFEEYPYKMERAILRLWSHHRTERECHNSKEVLKTEELCFMIQNKFFVKEIGSSCQILDPLTC